MRAIALIRQTSTALPPDSIPHSWRWCADGGWTGHCDRVLESLRCSHLWEVCHWAGWRNHPNTSRQC